MADIIVPRRAGDWVDKEGNFTLRALRFFESLTDSTNTVVTDTANETGIGSLNAQLLRLREQVGSGVPITIDTTGFTIDNTQQTIDQTEVR
jgi:hypothetical protein